MTIDELLVADPVDAWRDAGFHVDADGVSRVGSVRIRLVGRERGRGIVGWSLRGVAADSIDGIPTTAATREAEPEAAEAREHPNGVTHIDHVVLLTPDLRRTVRALEAIGLDIRRERDGELGGRAMRQVFFRMGEVILEVVGAADEQADGPASLWGVTFTVADIDATAALLGERTSPVKDAVQPGRRITTLRHRDLGLSVRIALISPHVRS
ncbi:hypothetical protein GCM10022237_30190 [Nocardioides ginsengisoli]